MQKELVVTNDGSSSIFIPELNEHYHSSHGALQEARHVFITNGLKSLKSPSVSVFEMGFGTGLNALLTLEFAISNNVKVQYTGIEAYPVPVSMTRQLNYPELISPTLQTMFDEMHNAKWEEVKKVNELFELLKIERKIQDYQGEEGMFDIVYFDAFGYRAQSEMWDLIILEKMHHILKTGGLLVTYAARGQFKRDLKSVGFEVESLPGPPGKREMTRAIKV